MIVVGQNLYRVTYRFNDVEKLKDQEFRRLVVAYSEKEAAAHVGAGVVGVALVENDISLCVPEQYLRTTKGGHL